MKRFLPLIITSFILSANAGYGAGSVVAVSATVLSKSNCRFATTAGALDFGSIDPANTGDVIVVASIDFRCTGSAASATFSTGDDDGLYETGPDANRMRHTTISSEYLPYTMTLSPTGGTIPKNVTQALSVTGIVRAVDYHNAYAGNYSDTVKVSIVP